MSGTIKHRKLLASTSLTAAGLVLGNDRIFFGSDGSYYQAVGKILASNATEVQRKKIFFDNYNNILKKGGHNVA